VARRPDWVCKWASDRVIYIMPIYRYYIICRHAYFRYNILLYLNTEYSGAEIKILYIVPMSGGGLRPISYAGEFH